MERKSEFPAVFEALMDTIRSSVSFPYKWELFFFYAAGAVILDQVVDLFGCILHTPVQVRRDLFGYEVAY